MEDLILVLSTGMRQASSAHSGTHGLPLLNDSGLVREVGGTMKGLLGTRKIVKLNKTISKACPCVPLLRIIPRHLFEHRHGLTASSFFAQLQRDLDARVGKVASYRVIMRR